MKGPENYEDNYIQYDRTSKEQHIKKQIIYSL